jgi:hypothetical protein
MHQRRRILMAAALLAASLGVSTTAWAAPPAASHVARPTAAVQPAGAVAPVTSSQVAAAVSGMPWSSTFDVYQSLKSRIFKSSSSRICASIQGWPKSPFGSGQPNIYVSLMHYHPLSGVYASENRPPVWFPLNGQWYVYCWTGQNTANQWSLWLHDVKWTYGAHGNVKASN